MPFDAPSRAMSTGSPDRDRSRALAAWIAPNAAERDEAARKRAQRARDAEAGLVRVELRVPRAMAPALRFVAAVLAGHPRLGSHARRGAMRLRLVRMLAILNSEVR